MVELLYAILVFMLTAFVVLEGWDFGAGALQFVVGRNEADRGVVIDALGPLWIWHEVWLVGFGGMTFVAFPSVMASAFSGFYLALFLLLWCLILRGISIEARGHLPDGLWREFWDFSFATSNVLLSLLIGVALGNVIRGVPLDAHGNFAMPFFTDFGVKGEVGILDWYTLSTGVFTLVLFGAHGATYLTMKTSGTVHERSSRSAGVLWPAALALYAVTTAETAYVRPELLGGILRRPAGWAGAAALAAGVLALWKGRQRGWERMAFGGSCAFIGGLMTCGASGVFPVMLKSTKAAADTITAYQGATDSHGLRVALVWWPLAAALSIGYYVAVVRKFRGKVNPGPA